MTLGDPKCTVGAQRHPRARPFLRWIGGKRRLTAKLLAFVPPDARERRYFEPFLGAGSIFFALGPRTAVLSDLNEHLIQCYRSVRRDYRRVHSSLTTLAKRDSETLYYSVRTKYNQSRPSASQAARFIFLNHTCFNGIFRVNRNGQFNVPYGFKKTPNFPTATDLQRVSSVLRPASLLCGDFETILLTARRGDFVYLDPPYPPLNGTSNFTRYTPLTFPTTEQDRLANIVRNLDQRGCLVMVTNADTPLIRALYQGLEFHPITVTRFVTFKSAKHRVGELVITNYDARRPHALQRRRHLGSA